MSENWKQKVLENTAKVIKELGGLPTCPKCGRDVDPHPLPMVVGLDWWTCNHGAEVQTDYPYSELCVPRRNWAPQTDFAREAFELSKTLK